MDTAMTILTEQYQILREIVGSIAISMVNEGGDLPFTAFTEGTTVLNQKLFDDATFTTLE